MLIADYTTVLEPWDIAQVQRVSKRVHAIARRDNELWRNRCFDSSPSETQRRRAGLSFRPSIPFQAHPTVQDFRQRTNAALSAQAAWVNDNTGGSASHTPNTQTESPSNPNGAAERTRSIANWDPSYSHERVDWYGEFIARHAPISMSWLQPVRDGPFIDNGTLEVQGLGLYHADRVVAPLEDGSVGIWDIRGDRQDSARGRICSHSKPGLLGNQSFLKTSLGVGIHTAISVDNHRDKAYVAALEQLYEIDLLTLKVSSWQVFPSSIATMSDITPGVPLTVGTQYGLHLLDPRQPFTPASSTSSEPRAPLFDPGPTSILHLFPHGASPSATNGEIIVAGRFPSLLSYDRRTFPKLRGTFHSGAQLCGLTSLPYSFSSLETDLMRHNQLSVRAAQDARAQVGDTLFACGEYQGKGSLEIYGLSHDRWTDTGGEGAGKGQTSTYKNRVSASRSKLLSIATHGTRLLVSDGDGRVRWLERDGQTLVRRWNINRRSKEAALHSQSVTGLAPRPQRDDVALKLLPVHKNIVDGKDVSEDEILVWAGERIGLMGFTSYPRFGGDDGTDWEQRIETAEEAIRRRKELVYAEKMKKALDMQADEVRWTYNLGMS